MDLASALRGDALLAFAEAQLGFEAQEFLVTLLLEPYGALVDDLSATMAGDEAPDFAHRWRDDYSPIYATRSSATMRLALETISPYPESQARFWYVSEEKLEPRLGERALEDGAERELAARLSRATSPPASGALAGSLRDIPTAAFLAAHPEYRHVVRRVQLTPRDPYAEVRDNLHQRRIAARSTFCAASCPFSARRISIRARIAGFGSRCIVMRLFRTSYMVSRLTIGPFHRPFTSMPEASIMNRRHLGHPHPTLRSRKDTR